MQYQQPPSAPKRGRSTVAGLADRTSAEQTNKLILLLNDGTVPRHAMMTEQGHAKICNLGQQGQQQQQQQPRSFLKLFGCIVVLAVLNLEMATKSAKEQQQSIVSSLIYKGHNKNTTTLSNFSSNVMVNRNSTNTKTSATTTVPSMILHVGPFKTGSTFLQTQILRFQEELKLDRFVFPSELPGDRHRPKSIHEVMNESFRRDSHDGITIANGTRYTREQLRLYLANFLKETSHANFGAIWSSEVFSMPKIDIHDLHSFLVVEEEEEEEQQQQGSSRNHHDHPRLREKQVRVVVVYRRLYEWYLSLYYQNQYRQREGVFPTFVEWIQNEWNIT